MTNFKKIERHTCCICGKEFEGYGNNPYPLVKADDYESRCCDECNMLVMKARVSEMTYSRRLEETKQNFEDYISYDNSYDAILSGTEALQFAELLGNKDEFESFKSNFKDTITENYDGNTDRDYIATLILLVDGPMPRQFEMAKLKYDEENYEFTLEGLKFLYSRDFLFANTNGLIKHKFDNFVKERNAFAKKFLADENVPIEYKNVFKLALDKFESVTGVKPILDI